MSSSHWRQSNGPLQWRNSCDDPWDDVRIVLTGWRDALRRLGREGLPPGSARAYLFAVACVGVAALAYIAFAQFTDEIAPSILYNPAVFVAALFGGIGAGLIAVAFSVVLLWWAFDSRYFGGQITALTPALNCGLYLAAAVVIIWVAERYRSFGRINRQRIDDLSEVPPAGADPVSGPVAAPFSLHTLREWWRRGLRPYSLAGYIVALACIPIATLIRLGFGWLGGEMLPLVSYYPAILLTALMGGTGAGLFAMVLSLVVVWLEFPAPLLSFGPPTRDESVGLSLYVFASLLTVWLAENHRHAVRGGQARESPILELATPVLVASSAVLLTTFVLLAVDSYLAPDHLVLGYLVPTIIIAMHYGSTLAVVTSFTCGIAAAYFLFPPKLSFYVTDPLHIAELGFFLLLAVIASKAVAVLTDDIRIRNSRPRNRARSRSSGSMS
jgi:K+-sensing histidine kinase KdpD